MDHVRTIIRNTVALSFLGIFTITPILILSQTKWYYYDAFARYQVCQNFVTNSCDIAQFDSVIDYIAPPFNTNLDQDYFSYEDIAHMQDVQVIFKALYLFICFCVGIITLYYLFSFSILNQSSKQEEIVKIRLLIKKYSFGLLGFSIMLGIAFLINWKGMFTLFHNIFFPLNNYWMLDPASSNLIKFLPNQIFQELGLAYLFITLSSILVLNLIWLLNKQNVTRSKLDQTTD